MKYLYAAITVFFSLSLAGQRVTVSEPLTVRSSTDYHLIGYLKDHILVFHDQGNEFEVQAFDDNLRGSWNKSIELDEHRPEVLDVISTREGFNLIYKFKNDGNTFLKVHKYDPAANLVDSATIRDMGGLFFSPNYRVVVSQSKNKALVYEIERLSRVNAWMVDLSTLKLLWETTIEPEDFTPIREFKEIIADDAGNMYLILERENRKSRREDHHFEIFSYGPDYVELRKTKYALEGKLTFDVSFHYDNLNDNLIGGGLYSEDNIDKAEGYFYLKMPVKKGSAQSLHFHPFTKEFVSALIGKQVDENKGVPEILVRELVLRSDGGILLIAERTKIYERHSSGFARSSFDRYGRYIIDYYYDDLFVASVNPDGSIQWEDVLHKKQYSQDDGAIFSSYFLMKTPQNLRLIFNDEIKNENTVSEYLIHPSGKFDRNSLFSTENQDLRLSFRNALQTGSSEIIVPSEKRNKLKLVRIIF